MVKNLSGQNLSGYLSRKTIHPQMKSRITLVFLKLLGINLGMQKTSKLFSK